MDGWEQLAALQAVYDGYLEEYRQRLIDNGPFHGLHKFLLGNAPASDRKADNAFFKAVQQAVGELEQALSGDPGPAAPAVRFMILEAEGPDSASDLMMTAAQGLAIPLVAHLSDRDRRTSWPPSAPATPRSGCSHQNRRSCSRRWRSEQTNAAAPPGDPAGAVLHLFTALNHAKQSSIFCNVISSVVAISLFTATPESISNTDWSKLIRLG